MRHNNPLTIGYLAPNVAEGNGLLLWQGILEQAKKIGVRLVTFSGGELHYPEPYFHQANQVYELADHHKLDGLIVWTSSLATFIGQEAIHNFCANFLPFPLVGIGMPLPGVPSIILESYKGMREAVLHLIQVHGKKRIVYIRGPERHYDAQERLRAYLDVIKENNLDQDPDLITPPCRWIDQDAGNAMRYLVKERRIQFDSIAAVNDQLAFGAMQYLQEQGYRLPEDFGIVGFDNNPISRISMPPLTTIPNLMRERGLHAMKMILKKIQGEDIPEIMTLSTGIKIRQSCGCRDPYVVQAGKPVVLPESTNPIEIRSHIVQQLHEVVPSEANSPDWPDELITAFESSLATRSDEIFISTLQGLLHPFVSAGLASREWQAALSEIRQWVISQNPDQPERIEFGERLLHQGRVMISEMTTRFRAHQEWMRSRKLNDLHRLRQTISACETLDTLLDILAVELPRLGIQCGSLALYQDSIRPLEGSRIVLAFNQHGRLQELEGQIFSPSYELVPPALPGLTEELNLIVHSLHFGSEQLGFLVVDASAFEGSSHQVLREQISSGLKSVLLIEQNLQLYQQARQNQQLAEEANLLKSRFLSIVSHELLTPIVLLVGLSEMMLREEIGNRPMLPDPYRQDLTRIHASAQQLGSLVRDVLDLSRSQLGQLTLVKKPLDIVEVIKPIELVCEQMAISKGLLWQVNIPENLPLVMGDASRLQQVVLNLFSNAVKFTSQGSVKIGVEVEDGFIKISVKDTGLSVPLDEQDAIFDEFRQSDRTVTRGFGGLGIGLAICRQLVEMHGGKIGVHSSGEENSGSIFYFTLPVLTTPSLQVSDSQYQSVVILSEQEQNCEPLRQHLERQGFQVLVVETVRNSNWMDSLLAESRGALVMDFHDADHGWKILEIIKQHPEIQDLPIIFYSLLQEQNIGSMLSLDYLAKPVAQSRLTQILERYGISPEVSSLHSQSVLIVDDDQGIRELHNRIITEKFPGCQVISASNGRDALDMMRSKPPSLILLDLMMPEMDGMAVLKTMQEESQLQDIPVIVLTAQQLSTSEMAVLNQNVINVLSKGIFTTEETLTHIENALSRHTQLGTENQRMVRKVVAFVHEQYDKNINRKELADFAGVSERHLNRCFTQEIGMTPLTYLNRYRIQIAKKLLEKNNLNITEVMIRVGFSESSHFAHVFRRQVGVTPSAYKKGIRP